MVLHTTAVIDGATATFPSLPVKEAWESLQIAGQMTHRGVTNESWPEP